MNSRMAILYLSLFLLNLPGMAGGLTSGSTYLPTPPGGSVPPGIWASGEYKRLSGKHDSGAIVIDEVAGQWIALLFVPLDPLLYGAAFLLFRVFDIVKPFPANWADREMKGGLGVMADDLVAGIYALIVLKAVEYFLL